MEKKHQSAMNGKGFYAALSLCVAMVGAACFYAYNQMGKPARRNTTENSLQMTLTTAKSSTTHTRTTTTTQPQTTPPPITTENAEAAAAMFGKHTEPLTEPPTPASTEAPVEHPIYPVDGEVLQFFSNGELVKSPTTGVWQTHNGIDIAAPLGTEVLCVADGTVSAIDHDALWGICVTVLHENGTQTHYCGLNEGLNVFAGQVLERGTVIGAVGNTADAEGSMDSHLHFEVMQNGSYSDPIVYLAG